MSVEQCPEVQKKRLLGSRVVAGLEKTFGIASGIILFVLMVVVTVDVIGRYIFSAPLRGSFEYVQIAMAMLVFMALPVITAREENVEVEVFQLLIPKPFRRLTRVLGFAMSIIAVVGLGWVSYLRASSFHESGERFVLLPAPLYPVAYFIFAMWAVCAVVMVFQFIGYWTRSEGSETEQ